MILYLIQLTILSVLAVITISMIGFLVGMAACWLDRICSETYSWWS